MNSIMHQAPCPFCSIPATRSGLFKCVRCTKDNHLYSVYTAYDFGQPAYNLILIRTKDYDIIDSGPSFFDTKGVTYTFYTFKYNYESNVTELRYQDSYNNEILFSAAGKIVTPSTAYRKLETLLTFL